MKFVQIIDFETERIDEVREMMRAYEEQARSQGRANSPTARMLLKDRADANRYLAVVEFDSHESAMANSDAPETDELARRLSELMTRPPVYTDCDVHEQHPTG
ncbi:MULTISPECIES: hypothetical protein [Streptomyces]|uniref:Antibiotic biosynthesis monooxygenase n=1 Tax=Streptomyces chilikensis TaxID=1194079 RepID=A0ABV3ELW8_9ACTN|nr:MULTISPECIES: hypothetical protein [Streptomyces]MDH6223542.1 hypothetical protein [Streptomyces sp. MJP52]